MNEPAPERSQNPGCLRCHQLDKFQRVEAVIRSERSTGVVRGRAPGRFGYDVPVSARVVQTSALARDLARPVMPRSATWPVVVLGGAGLLAAWNLQRAMMAPGEAAAWFGALFFAIVAVGSGAVLRTRRRDEQVMGPVVEGAIRLWRWSWYCRRCAVVSVLTPAGSTTVNGRVLAPALIELSRKTRWQPRSAGRPPVTDAAR
jgi:hypothetical protein